MERPLKQDAIETDALVIGAGPVGLFQVFELGLLEIKAHVVDALAYPGGQCVELYPDKPIYDIPGVPVCTGQELTNNLLRQIAPLGATFHLGQTVTTVEKQTDGRFFVETSTGTQFITKTLFIAAGVGAFEPRGLKVDGLDAFAQTQLFYSVKTPADLAGKHVVIVGDGDTALGWALAFADERPHKAASVTLIHRRDAFKAAPTLVAPFRAAVDAGAIQFVVGQITAHKETNGQLTALEVSGADGQTRLLPLDVLLVFMGLSPKLGAVADWGLDLERKQLKVDTEKFSTSEPGIFAVGDINTYPGKKKLLVSGFHEATLAAFGAMAFIAPEKQVFLQYTTTSPKLHKLLGVELPGPD